MISGRKASLLTYILLHLAVFASFAISLARGRFFITSDLFSMIPQTAATGAIEAADQKLTKNSGRQVFILSRNSTFSLAKENAVSAYEKIKSSPDFPVFFENLSLYQENASYQEIFDFLQKYRFNFLDQDKTEKLESLKGQEDFTEEALSEIFSGFNPAPLDNLEQDPFYLDGQNLSKLLTVLSDSGTNMSLKDGVLAAQYDNDWFVMIQGYLSPKGAALAKKNNGVQLIYDICLTMERESSEASFVFSGTPFHSHKSSGSASREITIISLLSLLAVLVMLIFTFRSLLPIAAAFTSILTSLAFAFCFTASVFGQIHALTLVFGTSLIGSCIDYSLHFFVNWKGNTALKTGIQIRDFLMKGLLLSLASTEICYFLLIFTPFPLLKQMAVFSLTGIFSSFLTVCLFYPLFQVEENKKRKILILKNIPKTGKKGLIILLLLPLIILMVNHNELKIHNNLSALYKMTGRLKNDTILASKVLNYTPSSWFIIQADTEEELLQKEEEFAKNFHHKYLALSRLIPSEKRQKASLRACIKLAENRELVKNQYEILDFDDIESLTDLYLEKTKNAGNKILTPDDQLPGQLAGIKKLLWLGKIDGSFYSVFMPAENISTAELEKLSDEKNGIYFENKVSQIGKGLNKLSGMILLMFALAFVIITVILRFFFTLKDTLKIAFVPLFSLIWILAVFTITKSPVDFFCITGIILVFGLGIDYIIYMTNHGGSSLDRTAIILSFFTTAISFGSLALSSFVPVHAIGLAIFTGLTAAFIATMELQ